MSDQNQIRPSFRSSFPPNNVNYHPYYYQRPGFKARGTLQWRPRNPTFNLNRQYRTYHPYNQQQKNQVNLTDFKSKHDVKRNFKTNMTFNNQSFLHPSMTEDPWKHLMENLQKTTTNTTSDVSSNEPSTDPPVDETTTE